MPNLISEKNNLLAPVKLINHFLKSRRKDFFMLIAILTLAVNDGKGQSPDELVIVTFGNSTTAPQTTFKVYAVQLQEILASSGINSKVQNAGIGGSHSGSYRDNNKHKVAHAMDRLDTSVLSYHPDWVTINFGINDSWQDDGEKGSSRIPIQKYRENLSFFIDRIRAEGGKVILLTPNPIGEKYRGFHTKRLKQYMKVTKRLAKSKQTPLINSWKLFSIYESKMHTGIDSLLLDGMHPNETGHTIIAKAIGEIIINSSINEGRRNKPGSIGRNIRIRRDGNNE
jgi:lysophospholipase L1-like esterase